jgi:tetratricopeptide (TPR) repeat protein
VAAPAQQVLDLGFEAVHVDPAAAQQPSGTVVGAARHRHQEVLGADVVMGEPVRHLGGLVQRLADLRAQMFHHGDLGRSLPSRSPRRYGIAARYAAAVTADASPAGSAGTAWGEPAPAGPELEQFAERVTAAGQPAEALAAWFDALREHRRTGDEAGRYRCAVQLAVLYQRLGRWPDAERALDDAHGLAVRLGRTADLAWIRAGLAAVHVALGRFEIGLTVAATAVGTYRDGGDAGVTDAGVGLGRALVTLGQCQSALGDDAGATRSWDEAHRLLEGHDADGSAALATLRQG